VRTLFVAAWAPLFTTIYRPDLTLAVKERLPLRFQRTEGDFETYALVVRQLLQSGGANQALEPDTDIDAFFVLLHSTDDAGHSNGFYQNPNYVESCKLTDAIGYDILEAIESRETYAQEDWLTIIVTDHGGYENHHGGQSVVERSIWLAVNQAVPMTEEYLKYARK
ncbi:MAG: hypothetical protein IJK52_04900, partial [Oscillospiraceae bacterium]|nr:hypothetical protein [Oscillospiraceae bacterium]